jgi:hypothetical protein
VADYVIFLTTLYDVIFQWWSYTSCNGVQNLCGTSIKKKFIDSASPDLNVMEWSHPCPSCWVYCLACPNRFTWCLTQHNGQGLDQSIVHFCSGESLLE